MNIPQNAGSGITVVTATRLEYNAARRALPPSVNVIQAGISLKRNRERIPGIAISCGVAGGLRSDLPTGTVVVARSVRHPGGTTRQCDPDLVDAFIHSARELGHEPVDAPILTSAALVHGAERQMWALQGYAAVDMESALIDADRVACVRVILDTPQREISPAWGKMTRVILHPRAWQDLPFLAKEGPHCARLAALIVSRGIRNINSVI